MVLTLIPETIQILQLAAYALGLGLGLIVFGVCLGEIGAFFIETRL